MDVIAGYPARRAPAAKVRLAACPAQECLYVPHNRAMHCLVGRGPGHPFGPESVPSATSVGSPLSTGVPGPLPGPTPPGPGVLGCRSDLPPISCDACQPAARHRRGGPPGRARRAHRASQAGPGPRCPRAVRLSRSQRCEAAWHSWCHPAIHRPGGARPDRCHGGRGWQRRALVGELPGGEDDLAGPYGLLRDRPCPGPRRSRPLRGIGHLPAGGRAMTESPESAGLRGPDRGALARGGVLSSRRRAVHRAGQRRRPGHLRPVQRGQLPGLLQRVRGPAAPGTRRGTRPGHEQPAVLEVVRRRQAERLLQLRRPAPGGQPEQDRDHLGARARGRRARRDHLPGAATAGSTSSPRCCATSPGCKAGDRVTLHMPMVPELPVTMLACARLGVIHSQVFGGFSGTACGHRIADSGSHVLITMDGYYRSGELIDHKVKADEAVDEARQGRARRSTRCWSGGATPASTPRRPRWSRAATSSSTSCSPSYAGQIVEPVSMPAEAPLFLMYTSGTTGRPEGLPAQHRRLPRLRGRHVEVLPGHPPGRHVLVHGRHRLDHRPLLHRLRPAGARAPRA